MQDLYLQLGIDPGAGQEEIQAAIKAKPELIAAADILLNGQRRAVYQRTAFTLRSIGTLRHRLGLDKDSSWFLETCADFAPRQHGRKVLALEGSAADLVTAAAPEGTPGSTSPSPSPDSSLDSSTAKGSESDLEMRSRSRLRPLLIVVAIAALLLVLYSFL